MDLDDLTDFLDLFPPETEEEEDENLEAMLPVLPPDETMDGDGDTGSSGLILSLPREMLLHIASFLSKDQLCAMRLSCKTLCQAADGHMLRTLNLCNSSITLNSKV